MCNFVYKQIRETPHKRHHKFIEFYDVRAAEAALRALNRSDIAGKRIKLEPSRPGGARRKYVYSYNWLSYIFSFWISFTHFFEFRSASETLKKTFFCTAICDCVFVVCIVHPYTNPMVLANESITFLLMKWVYYLYDHIGDACSFCWRF